jgi:hypothetical protein
MFSEWRGTVEVLLLGRVQFASNFFLKCGNFIAEVYGSVNDIIA